MKTLTFVSAAFAAICLSTTSCGSKTEEMQDKIDSLTTMLEMRESQVKNANAFIDLMNTSMDSVIMADGNFIVGADKEGTLGSREKMQENLDIYDAMLQRQRSRIAELEQQIKDNDDAANQKMNAMLAKMKQQLDVKDAEIRQLRTELADSRLTIAELQRKVQNLSRDVANLTETNRVQQAQLNDAKAKLTTGYYIVASKKELKRLNILDGGNLLRKAKLDLSDLNLSSLTKADIYKTRSIQIPDKSAKILTQVPTGSYTIQKNSDGTCTLLIDDPVKFWSLTDVLVVQY